MDSAQAAGTTHANVRGGLQEYACACMLHSCADFPAREICDDFVRRVLQPLDLSSSGSVLLPPPPIVLLTRNSFHGGGLWQGHVGKRDWS